MTLQPTCHASREASSFLLGLLEPLSSPGTSGQAQHKQQGTHCHPVQSPALAGKTTPGPPWPHRTGRTWLFCSQAARGRGDLVKSGQHSDFEWRIQAWGSTVEILEGWAAIQGTQQNRMQPRDGKCKNLYLGWKNPWQYRLVGTKAFLQKRSLGAGAQHIQGDAGINGFAQP